MAFIATIVWLAPAWGAALLALAIPLAVHLWAGAAGRLIRFPSIRLIQAVDRAANRSFKLNDLLLWLLRSLCVIAIVAAFANPVWVPADSLAMSGESILIVIDDSPSMSRSFNGVTLVERACSKARSIINGLTPSTPVMVVFSGSDRTLLPEYSTNLSLLASELQTAKQGFGVGDIDSAVRMGLAGASAAAVVNVHVIFDGQTVAWRSGVTGDSRIGDFRVHNVAGPDTGNVSLSDPMVEPTEPVVGEQVSVSVVMTNHSHESRNQLLMMNGPLDRQRQMSLNPGESKRVTFPITFQSAGVRSLVFSTESDRLTLDDRVGVTVKVVGERRLVVVSDQDHEDASKELFYLFRAIDPQGTGHWSITVVQPTATTLPDAECYLLHRPTEAAEALTRKVREGAGVIVLSGSEQMNRLLSLMDHRLRLAAMTGGPFSMMHQNDDLASGPWNTIRGPALHTLTDLKFRRAGSVRHPANSTIWATWPTGDAAIVTVPVGDGVVAVVGVDVSRDDSRLLTSSVWLPLTHELIRMVKSTVPIDRVFIAGEPVAIELSGVGASAIAVRGPDGEAHVTTSRSSDAVRVLANETLAPGVYSVFSANTRVDGFSVVIDPRESDLTMIDESAIELPMAERAKPREYSASNLPPIHSPLRGWFVFAAFLAAMIETLLVSGKRCATTV